MKKYRATTEGHKKSLEAIKRYQQKNPTTRFKHVVHYRERTGYYVPTDLHILFTASKRLETALAATKNGAPIREPSQFRCDQSIERRNRYGRS